MESLSLACRVCLQCISQSNSIFDEVEYDEYMKLSLVFKKVTAIEILESETAKPTHLCPQCTERLLNAYEFLTAVLKAEKEIEQYLDKLKESDDKEELQLNEDLVIETVDVLQEIEVLEEDFLTDHESVDKSHNDIPIQSDIVADDEPTNTLETLKKIQTKELSSSEPIGSRLSKRRHSRNLKCNSCSRSFAKLETLERHISIAHATNTISSDIAQQSVTGDEGTIQCAHCTQIFKRRNNFVRHLLSCHSKEAEYLSTEDKELAKTKNYKKSACVYCGEYFTQASLIIHIRRHTGENPYKCSDCGKGFPRRQDLNIHHRQHTGERPYKCPLCEKKFSRANKLARHRRVHTGERPYKCSQCDRSFTQSNDLKIHIRRHTGERPYKCSVCSESFICGAALKTHRKQKKHYSAADVEEDPFENWRVCKRKATIESREHTDSERNFKSIEDEELEGPEFKMEIVEITD